MAYINGIRSLGHQSSMRSKTRKRDSTEKWVDALAHAEEAHKLLREAHKLVTEQRFTEAEDMASAGVDKIRLRSVIRIFMNGLVTNRLQVYSVSALPGL